MPAFYVVIGAMMLLYSTVIHIPNMKAKDDRAKECVFEVLTNRRVFVLIWSVMLSKASPTACSGTKARAGIILMSRLNCSSSMYLC